LKNVPGRTATAAAAALTLLAILENEPVRADEAVTFSPHRAVYDISLVDSVPGSGVAGVTGRMVYELTGSQCDGYTQNMRFVTVMTNQEGEDTLSDLRNSSWEEAGGKRLRFSSSQYQNDQLADASQGDANHGAGTASTGVNLVKPAKKRVSLPADIYFPMQHAATLIQAAKSGAKFFTANLYDGSEKGEKYYLTNTVIGSKIAPGAKPVAASLKGSEQLAPVASWPLTISYFDIGKDKEDSLPAYELSFRYFENGVTTDLRIDYGEFAIRGELKQLTFLDSGKCPAPASTH
jgi:hypothetical protein